MWRRAAGRLWQRAWQQYRNRGASHSRRGFSKDESPGMLDETRYHLEDLIKFSCTLFCIHEYLVDVTALAGPSMLPTFNEAGDIVVVDCLHVKLRRELQKGDIVISKSPTNPGNTICKRILGLPGDHIIIQPQYWYQEEQLIKIPEGMVWLEGDNPFNSTDSRSYGPVPIAMLRGIVVFKLYPLHELGPVPRQYRRPGALYPKLNYGGVK